jgi:hypothetical protein
MVSPGDVGERLKPFIFLDHLNGRVPAGGDFGFHPHSGIATLTYQLNADVAYEDTTGQKGIVKATGLEWMRAGGGTWHRASLHPNEELPSGFQLWVALPPGVEDGPSEGIYVAPEDVPQVGHVRVLLGEYGGRTNPIPAPSPITYLDIVPARARQPLGAHQRGVAGAGGGDDPGRRRGAAARRADLNGLTPLPWGRSWGPGGWTGLRAHIPDRPPPAPHPRIHPRCGLRPVQSLQMDRPWWLGEREAGALVARRLAPSRVQVARRPP